MKDITELTNALKSPLHYNTIERSRLARRVARLKDLDQVDTPLLIRLALACESIFFGILPSELLMKCREVDSASAINRMSDQTELPLRFGRGPSDFKGIQVYDDVRNVNRWAFFQLAQRKEYAVLKAIAIHCGGRRWDAIDTLFCHIEDATPARALGEICMALYDLAHKYERDSEQAYQFEGIEESAKALQRRLSRCSSPDSVLALCCCKYWYMEDIWNPLIRSKDPKHEALYAAALESERHHQLVPTLSRYQHPRAIPHLLGNIREAQERTHVNNFEAGDLDSMPTVDDVAVEILLQLAVLPQAIIKLTDNEVYWERTVTLTKIQRLASEELVRLALANWPRTTPIFCDHHVRFKQDFRIIAGDHALRGKAIEAAAKDFLENTMEAGKATKALTALDVALVQAVEDSKVTLERPTPQERLEAATA